MNDHDRQLIRDMKAYYTARVPWHEQYMSYGSEKNLETTRAPIIAAIEPYVKGKRILDIACGTGNYTQVFARRARSILAIDGLPEPLEVARSKEYEGEISFRVHDAYRLDDLDETFEVVLATHWLSHVPYGLMDEFLAAVVRRLEPGGVLVSLDLSDTPDFQDGAYTDDDGNRLNDRTLPDGNTYPVVKNFPTEAELRRHFAPHFADVSYQEFTDLKDWLVVGSL